MHPATSAAVAIILTGLLAGCLDLSSQTTSLDAADAVTADDTVPHALVTVPLGEVAFRFEREGATTLEIEVPEHATRNILRFELENALYTRFDVGGAGLCEGPVLQPGLPLFLVAFTEKRTYELHCGHLDAGTHVITLEAEGFVEGVMRAEATVRQTTDA